MIEQTAVQAFVESLVDSGEVSAAAAGIWSAGEESLTAAAGWRDPAARQLPVDTATRFDLASVTKAFSGTLAAVVDQSGELPEATAVGEIWERAAPSLAPVTLRDLLRHRAGLRRWMPLYAEPGVHGEIVDRLLDGSWADAATVAYSDLDLVLWTVSVERVLGESYAEALHSRVLSPLGLDEIVTAEPPPEECAACSLPTDREVELAAAAGLSIAALPPPSAGEPQDGNARFLGRAFGHAGLFATVRGVLDLGREWLAPERLLSVETVARAVGGEGRYASGWFRAAETRGGRALSSSAFGHEGFTGSSVWIDPEADRVLALLAHRSSLAVDLAAARERWHRSAVERREDGGEAAS